LPIILKKYDFIHVIIGGDGNKYIDLVEMIKKHNLQDRVELLGAL